ncbi:MAG: hypothetical protein ABI921_06085 [Panacibacter sp.]
MKVNILRFLNIKETESGVVFDLMFVQLFLGIATAFLTIVSYSLFLHNYSINYLPQTYLCIAVTLVVINIFYEKIEHALSPVRMIRLIAITAIVTIVLFWLGLLNSDSKWIIFILLVWSTIVYMLAGYAFWGLTSLLFNIRESKRVFAIVGAGDVPAKLIGYISVALLLKVVSLENILWFSIAAFGIAIILISRFVKKYKEKISGLVIHHHHYEHHVHEKKVGIISFIFKNNLIFFISLFSMVSYIIFTLIDFTFLAEVKAKFSNVHELADFIATFFGVGRLLSLILKISITSRVIAKLGLTTSLLITPLALLISCLFFFTPEGDTSNSLYMFGMMALLTEVLRSSIQEPIFFILFQPLKEHLRLKGHMIAKGYMLPPALIIVGSTFLLFYAAAISTTILLTVEILIISIIIWCVIVLYIRKSYISTLHASIKKGVFDSNEVFIPDAKTTNILLRKIQEGGRMEVIYALQLLEKSNYENMYQLLLDNLNNKDKEIKKYVLNRIEFLGITSAVDTIKTLMQHETDTDLRNTAFNALSKLDDTFIAAYAKDLVNLDPFFKKVTITQILIRRQFDELLKAGNELHNLIGSQVVSERILALDIINELSSIKFDKPIETLLKDREPEVRKKAMITVAKLKIEKLLPALITALHNSTDKYLARKALVQYGDGLFNLQVHPDINNPLHIVHFIKIAGKTKGTYSTDFLLSHLNDTSVTRDKVILALWEKKFEINPATETKMLNILNTIVEQAGSKIKYFNRVPEFEDIGLLKNSIFTEIKNNLLLSLKICSMLYERKQVNRVLELIELKEHSRLYNGIEMLEIVLPSNIFKEVNVLLEFILNAAHSKTPAKDQSELLSVLEHIVYSPVNYFSPWTKALCIFIGGRNNYSDFLKVLKARPTEETEFVLQETRNFVLQQHA